MPPLPTPGTITRSAAFAIVAGMTGTLATACTFLPLGEFDSVMFGGYLLPGGQRYRGAARKGNDGSFYVFPGLVFGLLFGALMHRLGRLGRGGVAAYIATAVFVCLALIDPLSQILPVDDFEIEMAVSGAIAGAVVGGLLGGTLAHAQSGNWPSMAKLVRWPGSARCRRWYPTLQPSGASRSAFCGRRPMRRLWPRRFPIPRHQRRPKP
jgi:hypothetical protein